MKRRTLILVAAMAAFTAVVAAGAARAANEGTSPNRPIAVTESNVDEDGNIRVHEQGTVSVDVVTDDLEVTVSDEQPLDVELASSSAGLLADIEDALTALEPGPVAPTPRAADAVRFFDFSMERTIFTEQAIPRLLDMEPILATTLLISAENDELIVEGYQGGTDSSDRVFAVGHREMDFPNTLAITFPAPLPLDVIGVWCGNEAEDCEVSISVIGYEPTS